METNTTQVANITLEVDLDAIDYEQYLVKDIPATVFLVLVAAIGLVGNAHMIVVFTLSKRREIVNMGVRIFIVWLSCTDFVACAFCVPFEIVDIRFSYTFNSAGACKFFRFLNHVITMASVGFLTAIAIERYIIMNRVSRGAKKGNIWMHGFSGLVVLFSVLLSAPAFVFYGSDLKDIPGHQNITGRDCTILSPYRSIKYAASYTGVVLLLSTACLVICVVLYGKILCTVLKHIQKGKPKMKTDRSDADSTSRDAKTTSYPTAPFTIEPFTVTTADLNTVPISTLEAAHSPNSYSVSCSVPKETKATRKKSVKTADKKYDRSKRLTITLIIATGVSYLAFLIYVCTILVKIANPVLYKKSIRPATAILLRAYFINNAVNPIVFLILDTNFREECLKFYRKCFKCNFRNQI